MALSLYSEPYRAAGNIDARAARRALTQPESLDTWDLLLRETLQNSWDARAETGGRIHYRVDGFLPVPEQHAVLSREIFRTLPPDLAAGDASPAAMQPVLVITDTGTRGLAGPTRADISLAPGEHDDFVDFVRNVGRAEGKALGGGTYGFGKGVLYDSSICSTLVVFTRTSTTAGPVSRLMAIRLGSSYNHRGHRYTGRHWWGNGHPDTGAEPLTGPAADELAERVGLTFLSPGHTGTSLMILGPQAKTRGETLDEVVQRLATAALFWAWPHMLGLGGGPTITFAFNSPSGPVPVPSPAEHPALRDYSAAYLRARDLQTGSPARAGWPWTDTELRSGHGGRTLLGTLSQRRRLPGEAPDPGPQEPDLRNHVALMRDPRFVVRYRPAPADPTGGGAAAVFIADPEHNDQFALSEPVAHDEWNPANIPRTRYERNVVRQALKRLDEALRPPPVTTAGPDGQPSTGGLVALAGSLGGLLDGSGTAGTDLRLPGDTAPPTTGGRRRKGSGGGAPATDRDSAGSGNGGTGRPGGTGRVRHAGAPLLRLHKGAPSAVFPVEFTRVGTGLTARALPYAVVDGAPERPEDAPVGADLPQLLGWSSPEAAGPDRRYGRDAIDVQDDGQLWAWVSQPPDTAVTIRLTTEAP